MHISVLFQGGSSGVRVRQFINRRPPLHDILNRCDWPKVRQAMYQGIVPILPCILPCEIRH